MRGRWPWLIGILCLLLCLQPLSAQAEEGKPVLRVGYVPMQGFLRTGDVAGVRQYQGYAFDYTQFLAGYLGWQLEYVGGTWAECVARLQSGEIDLLPGAPGDANGLENVAQTRLAMGNTATQLVISGGAWRLDELRRAGRPLRLGLLQGSYLSPELPGVAAQEGFRYEQTVYATYAALLAASQQGQLDGYTVDAVRYTSSSLVAAVFDSRPYPLLVRADRTVLLRQINAAMDRMMLDEPDLRAKLYNKHYANGQWDVPLALSQEEREYIQEKKKLVVVTMPGEKPVSYFEDGVAHGVFAQVVQRMAADLDLGLEFIPTDTYAEALRLAASGKADIVAGFFEDFNWAQENHVILTQPYMQLDYIGVTRRVGRLPRHPKVACLRNAFYTYAFVEKRSDPEHCIYFDTTDECLQAVSDGRADITYIKALAASYSVWKGKYHDLQVNGNIDFSHGVVIGIHENADPRLLFVLNREINHLDNAFIQRIIDEENAAVSRDVTLASLIYSYPLRFLAGIGVLAVLVIAILLYINWLRRRHLRAMQHTAYTDARTGLPNLAWLEKYGPGQLADMASACQSGRVAMVVFKISAMQMIVESYGREFLARKMLDIVADIRQYKTWARMVAMGSDTAHLVCLGCFSSREEAAVSVEAAVRQYDLTSTQDIRIRLHLQAGICRIDADTPSLAQAIDRADIACNALQGTAIRMRFFDDALQRQLEMQQKIESRMEKALENKEFAAWYQPKYDIRTRAVVGAEALVRWQSPELGFLPPGLFIGLFERNGFVVQLDYFVLEAACALQRRRLDAGQKIVPISVNQSRLHMTEENYLEKLRAIVGHYALPPGMIELELTETIFGDFDKEENRQNAQNIIRALHEMGFAISVDDFGSGYSSLMLLNFLPMDVMKIDRSLLTASEDSERTQTILGNVIHLGESLHMTVICEGIETLEQEQLLLKHGCYYGQGFLNAKPMPEDAFEVFLTEHGA